MKIEIVPLFQLFRTGQVVITPGAAAKMEEFYPKKDVVDVLLHLLAAHTTGILWELYLDEHDANMNWETAARKDNEGAMILSACPIDSTRQGAGNLWIITHIGQDTTFLLPEEY